MKTMKTIQLATTAGLFAALLMTATPHKAQAQAPAPQAKAPAPQAQAPAPQAKAAPAVRDNNRPLTSILDEISKATQMTVIADSSVAQKPVVPPTEASTTVTLENDLTSLARRVGPGTQWIKLMLPELPNKREYKGDDVADYALAQARLFGNIGAKTAPNVVEIMGQKVSVTEATPVIAALNLKPVYVLINPAAHIAGNATGANNWGKLSPDEQKNYAQQQAQMIRSMSPAQRTELMQQQRAVMGAFMQSMSPEERQQMFQGMRGGGGNNGTNGGGRRNRGN